MKTVVFDIDGTMTDEVGFLRMHAPSFLKKQYGLDVVETNPDAYKLSDIYNLEDELKKQDYKSEEASIKADQISQEFWNSYFLKYCNAPLKSGVKETVKLLKKNGYTIHVVTMRGKKNKGERKAKRYFNPEDNYSDFNKKTIVESTYKAGLFSNADSSRGKSGIYPSN